MTQPDRDSPSAPVVAIMNTSEDIVELLASQFQDQGWQPVKTHITDVKRGNENFIEFIEQHEPRAILYDIAPPYEENWNFLKLIMSSSVVAGRRFVLTTTNKAALERMVGPTDAIEILGKPYDLEQIIAAVRRAVE